jgi:hypothetical protein
VVSVPTMKRKVETTQCVAICTTALETVTIVHVARFKGVVHIGIYTR